MIVDMHILWLAIQLAAFSGRLRARGVFHGTPRIGA